MDDQIPAELIFDEAEETTKLGKLRQEHGDRAAKIKDLEEQLNCQPF